MFRSVGSRKNLVTIALALVAIGIEYYYSICDTSCSYLEGHLFGIKLEYIGIAYMAAIIVLAVFRQGLWLLLALSAGLGVEAYLVGFQVWYDTYCPYCLAFGAALVVQFLMHFDRNRKVLMFASFAATLILFAVFFKGSAIPTFS